MTTSQFPIFDSPTKLAHLLWSHLLKPGDKIIDATLGNGHDAKKALEICHGGFLYGFDIQEDAIKSSAYNLESFNGNFKLFQKCHSEFEKSIKTCSVKLVIYNLGYLPKGNKEITTKTDSTIRSLNRAIEFLAPSGAISIMCYPGHEEGKLELKEILNYAQSLEKNMFLVSHFALVNRQNGPELIFIQKKN